MNNTEKYIHHLYRSINVTSYEQLSIDRVSVFLDIDVVYWEYSSTIANCKDKYRVFINEGLDCRQQWQVFGHEMAHFCWHGGSSRYLLQMYLKYQEDKADYFAYHFCVPTFMLMELKGVTAYDVMNLFNVEFDFALRRLEMYRNKLLGGKKSWQKGMSDIVAETNTNWK